MKKKLFFSCQSFFTTAQKETTILNHYTEVNKQIAESIENSYEAVVQ